MGLVEFEIMGRTLVVRLNNPPLNVLSLETLKQISRIFDDASKDKEIHSAILTGEKNFSAGADLKKLSVLTCPKANDFSKAGSLAVNSLLRFRGPVIAAINGYCIGGGLELILGCDIRIANKKAMFAQPEAKLGFITGFGATQLLPRIIGASKAKEMIFTSSSYTAEEAEKIGLVNKVVKGNALEEALKICEVMNKRSKAALALAKELVNKSFDLSLSKGVAAERNAFAACFTTEDQKEGIQAFLEKREPRF